MNEMNEINIASLNPDQMQTLYYVVGSLLIAILGYFVKDLHVLLKKINTSVIDLNSAVMLIRNEIKKDAIRIEERLNQHEKRLDNITDDVKQNHREIRDIIKQQLKDHGLIE